MKYSYNYIICNTFWFVLINRVINYLIYRFDAKKSWWKICLEYVTHVYPGYKRANSPGRDHAERKRGVCWGLVNRIGEQYYRKEPTLAGRFRKVINEETV